MPIIYIDVLFLINFIFDACILMLSGRLSGKKAVPIKIVCGAFLGGLYAALIFFPDLSFLSAGILKISVSALAVWICYFPLEKKEFLRILLNFYIVSFLLSGALSTLFFLSGKPAMMSNGVYYFPMTFLRLVATALPISMSLAVIWKKSKNRLLSHGKYCSVTIGFGENTVSSSAIIDSGCMLVDPYTNKPVIIIDKKMFGGEMPMASFRLIPYKTIDTSGQLLYAFTPDFCTIFSNDKEYNVNCCVAISRVDLGDRAIINPEVFGN